MATAMQYLSKLKLNGDEISAQVFLDKLADSGIPHIKGVLKEATVLYRGWEMDNEGWLVQTDDGRILAVTTSHGQLCEWKVEQVADALASTEKSVSDLKTVLLVLQSGKVTDFTCPNNP